MSAGAKRSGAEMADNKKFLKRLSDYDVIPATEYLIEPYVPMGALIFVAGRPKTFKSFLSGIDWGYSFATQRPWLGRPTRKGRVAYYALEGFDGVLRRAEAWRLFYGLEKADGDNLCLIRDRISFAQKTCSANAHFNQFKSEGWRPDLVIIDTWFKVTAGAGVSEQSDMSVALRNAREFQDKLTAWKVEDGLPEVTVVVNAHTTYKGDKLFGSITQFADCDVLYQLERAEHADQATLECVDARDIEAPPAIRFEMARVPIGTAKGKEFSLVISKEVPIVGRSGSAAAEKAAKKAEDANKAEQDLVLMVSVLREFFGNQVTNGDWQKHMEEFHGVGWSKPSFDRRVRALKTRGWLRIVGDVEALAEGETVPKGALLEATGKAPGASESTIDTTAKAAEGEAEGQSQQDGNQSQQISIISVTPLKGGDDTAARDTDFTDLRDERPVSSVSSVSNQYHDTDAIKGGNSQASVASDGVDGSESDIAKAAREQLGRFNKGKSSAA
jgi:hypothetical protein